MVNTRSLRLPDDIATKIERDTKEQRLESENEYIIKALEHYLKCKKAEIVQALKLIPFRYPAKCLKCGTEIKVGEYGLWGRGVGAICIDCHVQKFGDKTLVKKFMKLKELEWLKKALEFECEEKADELRQFNFYEIIQQMHVGYQEIYKLSMEYLKQRFDKPEQEKQALDELLRLIEKTWQTINDANLFMKVPLRKRKKKKVSQ